MIDTHTHLYMTDSFPDGGKVAVENAVKAGVDMMVLPAVDRESVEPLFRLHEAYPENTAVALGLHPTEVEADWRSELRDILDMGEGYDLVAIGETGVDLHWDDKNIIKQMDAFGEQINLALQKNLPVIIHSRDALRETREVIANFKELPPMVFHSFTGGPEDVDLLLEVAPEAFFGINGVITFKNARPLQESVRLMGLDRIVTETDSPFLAPVPFRGKTNQSSYIPFIVRVLASLKGESEEKMAEATKANALRLFKKLSPVSQAPITKGS